MSAKSATTGLRAIFPKHAAFETTHWPSRALLQHGPLARLKRLAATRELSSPHAFIEAVARARVTLFVERQGERPFETLVSPAEVERYGAGTTFSCFAAERIVPAVAALLSTLTRELALPGVSPTCHAYFSTRGARVRAHFDRQENLAIHLWGKKRWQIAENETIAFPFEDHALGTAPPRALQRLARDWPVAMPASTRTVAMRPGTALFLPRGMWHATETVTASLSLTILFPLESWAQTLTAQLLQRLLLEPRFREPAWTSPHALAEDFAAAARAVCDPERRVVVVDDAHPRLRGRTLETEAVAIAIDARYVPFVRRILKRRAFTVGETSAGLTPSEVSAIVSFLVAHGVLE